MVREPISLRQLKAWGLPNDSCHLLPDPAFSYRSAPDSSAREWLRTHGIDPEDNVPLLGMTVINWEAQNPLFERQARYEAACAETARLFVERYRGRIVLFPQVLGPLPSQDDRVPARRIADRLSEFGSSVLLIEEPISPDLLKSIYGLMSLFIGTRMHSNIFALSEGVPVVAIGYQPKTLGILEMLGLDKWAIGIHKVTPQSLAKKLTDLWEQQEDVRAHLQRVIPTLVEQASRGGAIIAADFARQEDASEHD
jgi:colanic acid/amylovoran biosynthesis protein